VTGLYVHEFHSIPPAPDPTSAGAADCPERRQRRKHWRPAKWNLGHKMNVYESRTVRRTPCLSWGATCEIESRTNPKTGNVLLAPIASLSSSAVGRLPRRAFNAQKNWGAPSPLGKRSHLPPPPSAERWACDHPWWTATGSLLLHTSFHFIGQKKKALGSNHQVSVTHRMGRPVRPTAHRTTVHGVR